ncbi:MAG: hypothetical protein ACRDNO_23255, partial [Trebonia sp.]
LAQLAMEPALDLDAYRDELVALFDRATRAALSPARVGTASCIGDHRDLAGVIRADTRHGRGVHGPDRAGMV